MELAQLLFFVIVIIPSAIFHEWAHAWAATALGDPTPRLAGRLTLNPVPHIDPWGTLFLPFLLFFLTSGSFLFAYAKPVPFNPLGLRNQKWGPALVGFAGPAMNLAIAFGLGLVIRLFPALAIADFLAIIVYANILLAVFNLVPVPPLDGSHILFAALPDRWYRVKVWLTEYGFVAQIALLMLIVWFGILNPIVRGLMYLAVGV